MLRQVAWMMVGLMFAISVAAAPEADLWERWTAHDAGSTAVINHKAWDKLLKKYVTPAEMGLNRFNYGSVTVADSKALADYLTTLQATKISDYNRAEQRAYWINLYNAATIKVVLDHYPVDSIRDIDLSGGLFGLFTSGPWDAKLLKVEGQALSLNDIEHRILRPIWKDPLIHYSVNCASVGCPNLVRTAYTSGNFKKLAAGNARAYVNSRRGVRVEQGELYVSSIYEWFKSDFGGTDARVIAHLMRYAKPPLARRLTGITAISGDDYDWSLNDVK